MNKKICIAIIVGLVGISLLINGYYNGKQQSVEVNEVQNTTKNSTPSTTTTTTTITTTSSTTTTTTTKAAKKVVKTTKKTTKKVSGFNVKASKSEMQQYAKSILNEKDYEALDFIITHESGWNANNINKKSHASGLCQALPASKMAVSGKDYKTNYKTQINWCILYCNTRYGSIQKAKQFWLKHHWF